jgi:hypothetical protein
MFEILIEEMYANDAGTVAKDTVAAARNTNQKIDA